MPRFLISVIDTATASATAVEMAAIDEFNARLEDQGYWLMAAGLASPQMAAVVDSRPPEPVVTRGPATDTPEYVSGFWIIDAPDYDTALGLAVLASRSCHRRVELREFLGG